MTPAERALLLAVANKTFFTPEALDEIRPLIAAVEAEQADATEKADGAKREWNDIVREWHDDHRT